MKKYQVTVNHGRVSTFDIFDLKLADIQSLYSSLCDSKITSVKEYVYINTKPELNNNDSYNKCNIAFLTLSLDFFNFEFRFFKKGLTTKFIKNEFSKCFVGKDSYFRNIISIVYQR